MSCPHSAPTGIRAARAVISGTAMAGLLLAFGAIAADAQAARGTPARPATGGVNVGGGERGIEAVIIPGRPISGADVMGPKHATFPRGMTCAECHDVSFPVDAVATATRQIAGSWPQLTQAEIWARIVAFLPGRERFALTTVAGDEPLATTVDMVLDRDEQVFYVVSERGTEKLNQIRRNPKVSAVRFAGWTLAEGGAKQWRSTQLKGRAEVLSSDDPRFLPLIKKYQLARLTEARAVRRFDVIRITPEKIWYFDTTLSGGKDEKAVYQLWERGKTGSVASN